MHRNFHRSIHNLDCCLDPHAPPTLEIKEVLLLLLMFVRKLDASGLSSVITDQPAAFR
jgi:hypothetical protein